MNILHAFLLSVALFTVSAAPNTITYVAPEPPKPTLLPAMVPVCTCESGQGTGKPQQYDIHTGEVLRGHVNPNDIGMCQINIDPEITDWARISKEHGWDVFTEDGNIQMANWIYENSGIQNWNWSRGCWGN